MNLNQNFVELDETILIEVNAGIPWKLIGKGLKYVGEGIIGGASWYIGEKIMS